MNNISNVFVLMMENRSFDHMLGFSGIKGLNGLTGSESNTYNGVTYKVTSPADETMPIDPGHEFPDVVTQLAGPGASYPFGGAYPAIDNSGFVADYAHSPSSGEGNAPGNFGEIMKCFDPSQLPVLVSLAQQFTVCDNWHASMPGPTWPNRLFALGSSSGGLDHSPTTAEMLVWDTVSGFRFPNGSIFDALTDAGHGWKIYADGLFAIAGALHGIQIRDISRFSDFASDVSAPGYNAAFTFIEPDYGYILNNSYLGGTSQHPLDYVSSGETFIKSVYEAIRNSPLWETSLLIITWDEHGGFYDHAKPPAAVAPGDTVPGSKYNQYGFTFQQYGVRVPAVVVSPLIPAGVDHTLYDHTSINATVEKIFGIAPLTKRDAAANHLLPLLSLTAPRTDIPEQLPEPAAPPPPPPVPEIAEPDGPIDRGNLPGFLHVALRYHLAVAPPEERGAILARVRAIRTRGEAAAYMDEVQARVTAAREVGQPIGLS